MRYKREVSRWLIANQGQQGFCVESTIQSALTKDYNLVVVEDGHTTGERPYLKTEKVIEHYNWIWQKMIPTNGKIVVKNFEDIKNEI